MIRAVVAKVSEVEEGKLKECELGEGKVLLVREKDQIYAIGNKCTHYGAPLKKAAYSNGRIRCPWHGACFNVKTGDIEEFPGVDSIHSFKVEIEGEDVIVTANTQDMTQFRRQPSICPAAKNDSRIFLIVGAGTSGLMCAQTLRHEGYTGRIIMVGNESHLAYDRPKLTKALSISVDKIILRPASWYESANIELKLNTEVVELDADVKSAKLGNGETINYDCAYVATGGTPRTVPVPGHNLQNISLLRYPEQAHSINDACQGKRVVIVGSSFIGMEAASYIVKKAQSVVVVGRSAIPFEKSLGPDLGKALQKLHEKNGVVLRMERTVKEFLGSEGKVHGVRLDNEDILDADFVVLGVGVLPATRFLKGVTIERDSSVVADSTLKAAEGLFVGGDIVRYEHPYFQHSIHIEHWGMAENHGRIAAKNMLGQGVVCANIPYFWTSQYGKSLRYCGHASKFDEVIVDGSLNDLNFLTLFSNEGKIVAAASMDSSRDPVISAIAELMHNRKMLTTDEIKSSKPDFIALAASV